MVGQEDSDVASDDYMVDEVAGADLDDDMVDDVADNDGAADGESTDIA